MSPKFDPARALIGCAAVILATAAPAALLNARAGQAIDSSVNPGIVEIDDPSAFDRVLAVSDIHGMYDALIPLLRSAGLIDANAHWAAGRPLLLVVGDSIDKGPKSVEVIDLWMRLIDEAHAQGGQVIHLLGNHKAEFLADPQNDAKVGAHAGSLLVFTKPSELLGMSAPETRVQPSGSRELLEITPEVAGAAPNRDPSD